VSGSLIEPQAAHESACIDLQQRKPTSKPLRIKCERLGNDGGAPLCVASAGVLLTNVCASASAVSTRIATWKMTSACSVANIDAARNQLQ